jgi:pimeloyl-ACP methyl ester carboxylesterase
MARDTISFLERVVGGPAHLVGHSADANVALPGALRRPDLARRVVLISGVLHRDGWIPAVIDPVEPHEALARGYPELSPDGGGRFPAVAAKLARMDFEPRSSPASRAELPAERS